MAKNSKAVIVSTTNANAMGPGVNTNEQQTTEQWRYCWRAAGPFHVLTASVIYGGGQGDLVHVQHVVLAGAYAAYNRTTTTAGGRAGGSNIGQVSVRNLATGRQRVTSLGDNGAGPPILSPVGIALWQSSPLAQPGYPNGCGTWQIETIDARNGKRVALDSATPSCDPTNPSAYPADPFGDLQLQQCIAGCSPPRAIFAWWTHTGEWRSARVG